MTPRRWLILLGSIACVAGLGLSLRNSGGTSSPAPVPAPTDAKPSAAGQTGTMVPKVSVQGETPTAQVVNARTREERDELAQPMQAVYTPEQQARLVAIKADLNKLSGEIHQARQRSAAIKFDAVRNDPAIKALTARLAAEESALRETMTSNPEVKKLTAMAGKSLDIYRKMDDHLGGVSGSTNLVGITGDRLPDCALCACVVTQLPPHSSLRHEDVAARAVEMSRMMYASSARELAQLERALNTGDVAIAAKRAGIAQLRNELAGAFSSNSALADIARQETELAARQKEILAESVKIHREARREPIQVANPASQAQGVSGS